eukprot:GHVL01018379.1.p1 GENE.GHVL01018379.1~~GHVL01018379.1.p1  ORF type:complete len:326 (+),score=31.11 GHVL01018379.1:164-1141(+)
MKVSAALQILTAVMSSGGQHDDDHYTHTDDVTVRTDLDLGACLDVGGLEHMSQNLYADTDCQPENDWVENVIDMTSSGELTSSGDHAGIVPNSVEMPTTSFSFGEETLTSTGNVKFGDVESLALSDGDNATFMSFPNMAAVTTTTVDFSQFSALTSPTTLITSNANTIDMTSLQQLMTLDTNTTSQQSYDGSNSGNIPSALWNVDLTSSDSTSSAMDLSFPSGAGNSGVKESLKTRLFSRGSLASCSQESDATLRSTRSLSSSSSSLTQSIEEDIDDTLSYLEKREKNRLAAQKCRTKKREKTEVLQKVDTLVSVKMWEICASVS